MYFSTSSPALLAYRVIDDTQVPRAKREIARKAAALACDLLDAPRVRIEWFEFLGLESTSAKARQAGDQVFLRMTRIGGEVDDRDPLEIRLDVNLTDDRIVDLVGHEAEHASQALDGRVRYLMESELERQADRAGEKLLELWKATPPRSTTLAAVERRSTQPMETKQSWRRPVHFEHVNGRVKATHGDWGRWGRTEAEAQRALEEAMGRA